MSVSTPGGLTISGAKWRTLATASGGADSGLNVTTRPFWFSNNAAPYTRTGPGIVMVAYGSGAITTDGVVRTGRNNGITLLPYASSLSIASGLAHGCDLPSPASAINLAVGNTATTWTQSQTWTGNGSGGSGSWSLAAAGFCHSVYATISGNQTGGTDTDGSGTLTATVGGQTVWSWSEGKGSGGTGSSFSHSTTFPGLFAFTNPLTLAASNVYRNNMDVTISFTVLYTPAA